jgi:phosphate starvation-inducible protein PhoH and related proteins
MSEKELYLDGSSTIISSIFAGDPVKNIKLFEKLFHVRIVARGCRVKISSDNPVFTEQVYTILRELSKIHELGYSIHQKDLEFVLSSGNTKNIQSFYSESVKVGPRKNVVIPRTITQFEYIRSMKQKDIIFGIGPAGTGKTYLAMAMAISSFLAGDHSRIILTRPAMEAGENLGFLPGSLEEKIKPFLRPLYDALYEMLDFDEANKLIEKRIIEVAPLAFMRGRTLNNSFIILDEAQNTTIEQMMMFLTRLGFESKCIITGDPTQTDLPSRKLSGLKHASKILKPIKEIAFMQFSSKDVVRNSLVEKIINAYDHDQSTKKSMSKPN